VQLILTCIRDVAEFLSKYPTRVRSMLAGISAAGRAQELSTAPKTDQLSAAAAQWSVFSCRDKNPNRAWSAVVVWEGTRCWFRNQFTLIAPALNAVI